MKVEVEWVRVETRLSSLALCMSSLPKCQVTVQRPVSNMWMSGRGQEEVGEGGLHLTSALTHCGAFKTLPEIVLFISDLHAWI